jgi:CoA-transferase family III
MPSDVELQSPDDLQALARRWAESGAMWLTGRADGPALGCPAGVVEVLDAASQQFAEHSRRFGTEVRIDGLALLGERAAVSGLSRRGSTSCGGATRILQTADGYLALSLARPDDLTLLPALFPALFPALLPASLADSLAALELAASSPVFANEALWSLLARSVRAHNAHDLVERGAELGLAIAALPEHALPNRPKRLVGSDNSLSTIDQTHQQLQQQHGVLRSQRLGGRLPRDNGLMPTPIRVVDLSSLWAGPLCGQLLASAGCQVIKVESTQRPDGARNGSPEFFALLNGPKQSVALDFTKTEDLRALLDLLASADVVIEASRPRALEQLGIDRESLMATAGISVWLQITGHGATGPNANRIGFGDDTAVAAGLVSWEGNQPVFCADAIADPATGLIAASAVIEALGTDQPCLLDVSLRRVAESMAWGPTLHWAGDPAPPKTRVTALQLQHQPPAFGAHTQAVLEAVWAKHAGRT